MDKLLALDIGGGTQDILLFDQAKTLENCIQLVLPSPTVLVAKKIARITEAGKPLFLDGSVMGGGPSTKAIRNHLKKGLPVIATARAALTIHDNLEHVTKLGVIIGDEPPAGAGSVSLSDIDVEMLGRILAEAGEELPSNFAVAVQDHGYSPYESNRSFRFRIWEEFMHSGGDLHALIYRDVPDYFTRMRAVQDIVSGSLLMDTCGAALLGALTDKTVAAAAKQTAVAVVNLGNQHTFAAIIRNGKVLGLFEHHTGALSAVKAKIYLKRLLAGTLTDIEIRQDGGHGCIAPVEPVAARLIAVTGPRREMLAGTGYYFAAPQGNMMLMGCYGLIAARRLSGC
ncbi:MAG: pyruvate formate lyase-activating protein [Clostridiales bacterium]|jgi:uncharacterized protein (DUF1786 family)|nr:pyruvate formate lyase-activating protein [Clostridiales bacterium]